MGSEKIKSGYRSAFIAVILQVILVFTVMFAVGKILNLYAANKLVSNNSIDISEYVSSIKSEYSMIINAVVYSIADLLPVVIFMKLSKNKGKIGNWFGKSKISLGQTALLGFSVLALAYLCSIGTSIFRFIFGSYNLPNSISIGLKSDNKVVFAVTVLYVCLVGPFLEELLFRGFVLHETACVNPVFGVIVSSTLFGLFHLSFEQAISATIIGILFGYIALKANSIKPTVILHIINNTYACVRILFVDKIGISTKFDDVIAVGIITIGVIVIVNFVYEQGRLVRNKDVLDTDNFIKDDVIKSIRKKEKRISLGGRLAMSQLSFYFVYIVLFTVSVLEKFAVL
ncbi:MAG: CPBP family intramembrane metalloprotease [Clostridia bacterium]|nr:CPBP family intramembrane metalloprotease [Clostridia bacterium]